MNVYLQLIFSCLVIFFMPGYFIYRLVFNREEFNMFEKLPAYFVLSLGVMALFGTFAYIFNFTFKILWNIIITLCLSFFIIALFKKKQKQIENPQVIYSNQLNKKTFVLLALTALFLSIFLIFFVGISGTILEGDALNFLGFIRKLFENPSIANRDAFYREIVIDTTYGYNIWHLSIALVSWLAQLDPVRTWIFLPCIFTPIILLSFYLFAKTLFKSKIVALISLILFILYYGINQKMYIFRISPYNRIVTNFLVLPVALTFVFKYLNENRIKYLIIASFLGFVIATVHLFGFLLFILSLSSFYFFCLVFARNTEERINILKIILVSLIFIIPYLILRLPTINIINQYYLQDSFPDKPYYVEWLNKSLCYINPKLLAAPHYHTQFPFYPRLFYIVSFCLTPFLLLYVKKYNCVRFILSNMLIVPLITLNPILVPLLAKIMTFSSIEQISQLMPFLLVLGFLSYRILIYVDRQVYTFQKNSIYFMIFILILGLVNPLSKKNIAISEEKTNADRSGFYLNSKLGFIKFINNNIKETSVFLSDIKFSLFIPAYTKHYVMVTHPGHASPATVDQPEREEGAKKVLYQHNNIDEIISILKKYGVKYIILNLYSQEKKLMLQSLLKFKRYPQVFKKLYEENGIFIFEVVNRRAG